MKESNGLKHIYDMSLFNVDDFDVLLHEILKHARMLINAEAGTVYISDDKYLAFNVFQNDSLSYENIYHCYNMLKTIKLPLTEPTKYLAVESYISKKAIIIDDVYDNNKYDFVGVKEFDNKFAYKTKSLITLPLVHPIENRVLGVIQLLNKKVGDNYVCFDEKDIEILSMASSFISISISKAQTDVEKLEKLNHKLEEANEYLEEKIKIEMDENEKKNAIIFHQSKLVSMGEMIGNIAHQWRQPLSTISTISSGLCIELDFGRFPSDAKKQLRHIVDTTQHLSHTIDDFRNFYKIDKEKSYFNITKNINKCLSILNATISGNNIEVVLDLDETLEYYGYENEFIQAVLNIITNSKDALLETITDHELRLIFISLYSQKDKIILLFKDNGKGIDTDILSKIFDQNFTTKEESGGSGIGLFMTKEIIEKHMNGIIHVSNCSYEYQEIEQTGAQFLVEFELKN